MTKSKIKETYNFEYILMLNINNIKIEKSGLKIDRCSQSER